MVPNWKDSAPRLPFLASRRPEAVMAKVIDLQTRRPPHDEKRRDAKAEEMRNAFRSAREGAEPQVKSTRKLLDLYRSRKPGKR